MNMSDPSGSGSSSQPRATSGGTVDARPILRRSQHNIWDRIEAQKIEIREHIQAACDDFDIQALVITTGPYVHPAKVRFECWIPQSRPSDTDLALTARSSLEVTLTAVPFHRFDVVYEISWERHGRKGTIDNVYELNESTVYKIVGYLQDTPSEFEARNRIKRLIRGSQLRERDAS